MIIQAENRKQQELYLKEIKCDLNLDELEALFTILNSDEKFIQRDLFIITLKDFSGMLIDYEDENDLKRVDDLLKSLFRRDYIEENFSKNIVLTEKAASTIDQLTKNGKFWQSFSTKRWRRAILKKSKNENISRNETKIIKELIQKDEIQVRSVADKYFISPSSLRFMEKQRRISVDLDMDVIRRGSRFVEGLAEAVHFIETNETNENLDKWNAAIEDLFKTRRSKTSWAWRRRYRKTYDRLKELNVCPVDIPVNCEYTFKKDMDSIIEVRELSIRKMNLKIAIKRGFGYIGRKRYLFKGLVIEFIQAEGIGDSEWIHFNGTRQEMLEFFENIRSEAKKMSEETKIGLEVRKIGQAEVTLRDGEILVNIAALAKTGHENISAVSYEKICKIIRDIKLCAE